MTGEAIILWLSGIYSYRLFFLCFGMTKRPVKYRLFLISLSEIRLTKVMILCRIGIVDYFCGTIMPAFAKASEGGTGVWRSWLAHLHGVQGVVCSSQITPTVENEGVRAI